MAYPWLIPLIAALIMVVLAVVVNRKGPDLETREAFTFLASMLVLWNLNFFALYSVSDHDLALSLTRIFRMGGIYTPPAVLHLAVALTHRRSRGWRRLLIVDYAGAVGLTIANALNLFVFDVHRFIWGYKSVGGEVYNLFTIYVILNLVATVILLVYTYYTDTEPRLRLQLKFWLVGVFVTFPLVCTNFFPTYGIPMYPLGNLGTAVWAGIVAYAIVRHRLMDIDLVMTRGMAYAAVSIVLIAPTFAATLWLQKASFGRIHPDFSFAVLLMFIAIGVFFPTLRLRAQSRIERSFFREKHEHRMALSNFTRSIVRILDREKLIRELATTVRDAFQLDRIAVVLADRVKRGFSVCYALGVAAADSHFEADALFLQALAHQQEPLLRDDLQAVADPVQREAAADACRRNGWEMCIPLTAGNQLVGFLGLGRKRNLDAFFAEDLDLLGTLAAEASVALENARLYEELKRSHDIIRRADRLSALGTLAAGIAHEIRNPLVSIQTFFQLAPQRLNDQEFLNEFLRLTSGEVKRITDLISELLSFARSPTPAMEDIDLNELLEGVIRLVEPQVKKGHIEIERSLDREIQRVRADRDQLKQVFLNIFLNALQALEGSGRIILSSREVSHQGERFCQVQITDSGAGIPEELLEHIFNPFFTTKEKGTGLGLAISNQVVTEHGGFITAESEPGRGTSFFVHLRPVPAHGGVGETMEEPRRAVGGRMKNW